MYGCKKIHLQTGLLWDRRNQNADFSGAVLSDTGVTSNTGRNPYDHDTHIRYAGNVISSYDGNTYGTDGDYAMGGILVTTVCSIVTLPLYTGCYSLSETGAKTMNERKQSLRKEIVRLPAVYSLTAYCSSQPPQGTYLIRLNLGI